MVEVKYNTPIKVSRAIQLKVAIDMNGICAHRTDSDGFHWVSLWYCRPIYKLMLSRIIN